MKKILIVLLALSVFTLAACASKQTQNTTEEPTTVTTTAEALGAPTGLKIEKGVVTFDENGADSYTLKIKQDGELVMNVSITNGESVKSVLSDGNYTATIRSVKDGIKSNESEEVSFTIGQSGKDVTELNTISSDDLQSESYINYSGRTYYDESKEMMYFYYSASGFKVSFTGTELKATIYAGNYSKLNSEARLVVLVDGEVYPDGGHLVILNKATEAEYVLCEGLENGKHTVEVLKRSEASDNLTALKGLSTDGHFETPDADREKKILVIGASGSTGYGNLASSSSIVKNTSNSDCLRAFSYLTARMYDADVDMINASGWGVKWGWNDQSGSSNIPTAFKRVGINQSNQMVDEAYDYTKDSYDLIIVNLGMNDFNAFIKNTADTAKKATYIEQYKKAVQEFYELLVKTYTCPIILLHTSNTNENAEGIYNEEVAKIVNDETGSERIYSIIIPANGSGTNYGANSHANVQTHIWTADKISEWIESNLQWTKVRDNITFDTERDVIQ